jgi:uncharacterized protein involved in exopolysaccharide biosynthesis
MSLDIENRTSLELINIRDLISVCMRYKEYFLIPMAISILIALIYGLLATPIYKANVLLSTADEEGNNLGQMASQFSSLARLTGMNIGGGSNQDKTATNMAILTSRKFIEQHVVERELRPIIFSDLWDVKQNKWINDSEPTAGQTYKYISENIINVITDRRTGLIHFTIEWSDPILAAAWANNMINDLNNHIRKQAIAEIEKNIFFLQEQSSLTNQVNAQSIIFSLIEEQTKNIMLANVREEYAFKIIDPAVIPEMKVRPKRKNLLLLGTILGIVLGFLAVISKNYYENELAK